MNKRARRPVIFVSSSVFGIEELLDRIFALLTEFGYEVWMSHKGTVPVRSDRTAFENCLAAVDACDLFLALITPSYGSGKEDDGPSITHREIVRAIEKKKPRWLLSHDHVVFARRLLNDLGFDSPGKKRKLGLRKGAGSLSDLRVIDMYEEAIRSEEPLSERHGNWVQKFGTDEDALLFAAAQFSRFQEVERFIEENLADPERVRSTVDLRRGKSR